MGDESGRRAGWRLERRELVLIAAFWIAMAGLVSANRLTDPRRPDIHLLPPSPVILAVVFEAALWGLLTPAIFRIAARFSPMRRSWAWRLPLLLGIGFGVAAFTTGAGALVRHALPGMEPPVLGAAGIVDSLRFLNDLIIYMGVLAAGFARDYFRLWEDRDREALRLHAEAADLRAQLAMAELAALRMQLHPHFLFNTLHAVSALVGRDPSGVRRMIARLSELLRASLDEGTAAERTVTREIEFVERYLEIMQVRYQGRLDVDIAVEPGAGEALVPTLVLQPLVENAIRHGLEASGDGGRIEVRARRAGRHLMLAVRDDGPGPGPRPPGSTGVGLRNTEARLRQMYGDEARLSLRAAEGGGTVAEVEMPFRVAEPAPRAAHG